jgi:Phasin protein
MMTHQKFKRRTIMSIAQTPESFAGHTLDAATRVQQNFSQFTHAYQRFMKSLMNVTVQQIELSRGMMEGSIEDFDLLGRACTPDALIEAEFDVFRRRSQRAIETTQKVTDELRQTWAEALEFAQSIGSAGVIPAWTPARQQMETAP